MFIMLDGIDGSGKSTVIQAWKDYLAEEGNAIFDLRSYWQGADKYPGLEEFKSYDFIFSCEPTLAGIGKVIREELIKDGTNYPAPAVAEAYSLDRLILYEKIHIPLLQSGKIIIQDRGVCTSLAYQTASQQGLNFASISALPGNKLALLNRPDNLILMKITAETAIARLKQRLGKQDNSIFEKIGFLKRLTEIYYSQEYQNLFISRGTKIHYLNAEAEIGTMKQEAVNLLKKLLTK